jgi:transcriptional regulator with XRE-family HTH domain
MVDDPAPSEVRQTLAANLRRLRIARHLSLSELARATRTSKATLSSIENARANPTVETLAALAGALRIPMRELLEELPLGDIRIVRATQAQPEQRDGIAHRTLDSLAGGDSLQVAEIAFPPRRMQEVERLSPGSRAHLYLIQGRLLAGPVERVTELAPGDYASFPADVPHLYETERQAARALLLVQEGA